MAPEKRERKKPERFDPHPPGSKHQMMSSRSQKVKEKKQARERMQKLRKGDKGEVTGQEHAKVDDTEKEIVPTEQCEQQATSSQNNVEKK